MASFSGFQALSAGSRRQNLAEINPLSGLRTPPPTPLGGRPFGGLRTLPPAPREASPLFDRPPPGIPAPIGPRSISIGSGGGGQPLQTRPLPRGIEVNPLQGRGGPLPIPQGGPSFPQAVNLLGGQQRGATPLAGQQNQGQGFGGFNDPSGLQQLLSQLFSQFSINRGIAPTGGGQPLLGGGFQGGLGGQNADLGQLVMALLQSSLGGF